MRTMGLLGTVDLPINAGSARIARAYVRAVLLAAGHVTVDDVELLVSELMSNAVKHSASARSPGAMVRLRVFVHGRTIRIDIAEEGPPGTVPVPHVPAQADPLSESGRGLWLVRELSSAWGWTEDPAGRVVWFEVTPP